VGEVGVEGEGVVLEQEGAARGLEQDVVARVAKVGLLGGLPWASRRGCLWLPKSRG
jgi:hypothetical protein